MLKNKFPPVMKLLSPSEGYGSRSERRLLVRNDANHIFVVIADSTNGHSQGTAFEPATLFSCIQHDKTQKNKLNVDTSLDVQNYIKGLRVAFDCSLLLKNKNSQRTVGVLNVGHLAKFVKNTCGISNRKMKTIECASRIGAILLFES